MGRRKVLDKMLFCSDIHGSVTYTKMLLDAFDRSGAKKLVILGDFYYHGPRNPFTKEYMPKDVAAQLNKYNGVIHAISGNCDSPVDKMISDFPFHRDGVIICGKHNVFITHGHRYHPRNLPKGDYDIFIYGHTHVGDLYKEGTLVIANCGSVSLPKQNSPRSYLLLDNESLALYDLESGSIIKQLVI